MKFEGASSDHVVIVLPEVLDTAKAAALRDRLVGVRGRDARIDASHVRHLGALCAQVLLSALATWRAEGHRLVVEGPSEAFREAATMLGLYPHFVCEV